MASPSKPVTLSRAAEPAGRDAAALYAEALALLRQLAGQTWTDHNIHDPGITTLELATWALAELGYRASQPFADLLTPPPGAAPPFAATPGEQFHRARAVLPMAPLTAIDWRKLLIDLPGVKNAWVEPVTAPPLYADLLQRRLAYAPPAHGRWREVRLGGLYRAAIDFMDSDNTLAEQEIVLRRVRAAVEANRNLAEDFIAIDPVPTQRFALCAEIDLDTGADLTETAARLLFAAARSIAPAVPARSLADMRRRPGADGQPRSVADIFEGPPLDNGFIDETELDRSALPRTLRLSDLIGDLMDVPGVRAITDIVLAPLDASGNPLTVANRWQVDVRQDPVGHLPRLAIDDDGETPAGRLVFRKRGLPVAGWNLADMPPGVRTRLLALQDEARRAVETPQREELPLPAGRWRDLAAYRSLQLDFPALYGLGEFGLRGESDPLRRTQLLQFKAWLLFFDQQIANDLAQLAAGRHLLSAARDDLALVADRFADPLRSARTLAARIVDSIPDHARLYPAAVTPHALAVLQQSADQAVAHQQRLLDHLLARLSEDFSDYAATMASAFGHGDAKLIADKCAFLADAAELGARRNLAYPQRPDDPADLWNTERVSGLERRLARLLGIADFTRRNLGAVSYDTYPELDTQPTDNRHDEFRFRVLHAVDNKILLSSTVHFASREAARARMIEAIERGQDSAHYEIIEGRDGKSYFRITAADGHLLARRNEGFASREAAAAAIASLAAYLREHYGGEGLYVFENLLLRPAIRRLPDGSFEFVRDAGPTLDDPLLPICVDSDCTDCADADPYSWRLQIVLPAYAGRFQNMDFRRFVEHTIRSEVPAHLLPKICWVGPDDMARFEHAYRNWLDLHAGHTRPGPQARHDQLQALVDALTTMKNQYPQNHLYDCLPAPGEAPPPPFVLGRTALGSAPDHHDSQETDHG